jgi:hypothetical protein
MLHGWSHHLFVHQHPLKKLQRPLLRVCGGRAVKAVSCAGVDDHLSRLAEAAGQFHQFLASFHGHNGIRVAVAVPAGAAYG